MPSSTASHRVPRSCDRSCAAREVVRRAAGIIAAHPRREFAMALMDFIKKQFTDILQWTETGDGTLAWRYPMQDMEIQYGGSLTGREAQMGGFVNEGKG